MVQGALGRWETLSSDLTDPEIIKSCIATAKEAMAEPQLMECTRKVHIETGNDGSMEDCINATAGMFYAYKGGYNSAEPAPQGCQWIMD